eukprot:4156621-Prymnesium_polylepis.1
MTTKQPKVLIVNAARVDFDKSISLTKLSAIAEVSAFDERTPAEADSRERIAAARPTVIVTKEIPVGRELIESFPESVKLICEAGTGFNNIDLDAARGKGITVCNVAGYSTDSVATLVITMVLSFSSSLVSQQRMLALGDRSNFPTMPLPHFEVGGKTLGLVGGAGAIGSRVAAIAQALGMHVLVSSRSPRSDAPYEMVGDVGELLERSDFVSLHCPLTPRTRGMIDAKALKRCKPTAYIINTARERARPHQPPCATASLSPAVVGIEAPYVTRKAHLPLVFAARAHNQAAPSSTRPTSSRHCSPARLPARRSTCRRRSHLRPTRRCTRCPIASLRRTSAGSASRRGSG